MIDMRKIRGKKAVSPVVATVLLIALVLVMAMIIFLWANGFFGEITKKSGVEVKKVCGDIVYTAAIDGANLKVQNDGDIPIYSFQIRVISGGKINTYDWPNPVDAGQVTSASLGTTDTGEIQIVPQVVTDTKNAAEIKLYTCEDSIQTIYT